MGSLAGRRVLVTRPVGQGSRLAALLQERGAVPVLIPTIELAPPASWCGLDAALACLRSYDVVVFTSANAVRVFAQRARQQGIAASVRRVAVIGSATAQAVAEEGIEGPLDALPGVATGEALLEALRPGAAGTAMLLVRAAVARDVLPEGLAAAGATVTIAEAYRTVTPDGSAALLAEAVSEGIDAVTFTSASTAENLVALLSRSGVSLPTSAVLASIGPVTSQAMRGLGLEPMVESAGATISGLVDSLESFFINSSR